MIGAVTNVVVALAGCEVLAGATAGATSFTVVTALDLSEGGGDLVDEVGTVITYASASHETGVVVVAEPLPVDLPSGSLLTVSPAAPEVTAEVLIESGDGDETVLDALVPTQVAPSLPSGVREPGTEETVRLSVHSGALTVESVLDVDSTQRWGDSEMGADGLSSPTAVANVRSLASEEDVLIAGVPLLGSLLESGASETPGWLERFSAGVVARDGFNTQTDLRPAGEEWGYAGIGATLRAGRLYRVSATSTASSNVVGAITRVTLRYAYGGEAGLSSPVLAINELSPTTGTGTWMTGYMEGYIGSATDTAVDVLLTHVGLGGNPSRMGNAYLVIEDVGPQGSYGAGSLRIMAPASNPSPPPPPPPTVREYTSTWRATDHGTYRQSGVRRTDAADMVQGYASGGGINGHNQAACVFMGTAVAGETGKTISAALSEATLRKVELWLYFDHWWNSAGGTARIGKLGAQSIQSTLSASPSRSEPWKRDQGKWVALPVSWFTDSNRGITLGGGTSRLSTYYGRALGSNAKTAYRPRLRLTYTR